MTVKKKSRESRWHQLSTSTCNYNTDKGVLTGNLRRNTKTFTGGCTSPKVAQNKK